MAQTKAAVLFLISIFLLASLAQSRILFPSHLGPKDAFSAKKPNAVSCNEIHGTQAGETCTTIAKDAELTFGGFLDINPNVNCDSIFVGQWLCVNGAVGN